MKRLIFSISSVLVFFGWSNIAFAGCGKVTIAEMTWGSAAVAAHVQNTILSKGFGCKTELVPGDTVPTVTSMTEKGEPDLAPEVWINSARKVVEKAVAEGRLKIAGEILSDGGEEGWWVPEYVVKKYPNLKTLQAVLAKPGLFPDKEEPGKGRFYTCPPGWACEIVNKNLYKAYGLKKAGFTIFNPGSGKGLSAAIAQAYERKKPIFTYYWAPTAVLGKYPMVKLGGMKHDAKSWSCVTNKDCASPKKNMYPKSTVVTVATSDFANKNTEAYGFISKFSWPNKVVNELLAWKEKTRSTAAETANHFIANYKGTWSSWVSAEVAAKINK
ncbi:MAG: hypothetical protein CFH41_00917 [Alphaproteobacteria bacterium MarineAlpha11_Bin1]|nr:MAG: hypothetical protein CFH41_00917 [Alphaproteobacteria bacterium MarineAlpha11_Bin1]|tara:strand:+ start:19158 stop:20141 length:984 start_codon:yes stop_codon:yes gene_type:complete